MFCIKVGYDDDWYTWNKLNTREILVFFQYSYDINGKKTYKLKYNTRYEKYNNTFIKNTYIDLSLMTRHNNAIKKL